jgi:hypothetical protein
MDKPDFVRMRREIDKLNPSFSAALDRAFDLMRQPRTEKGGDKHHGLMKSIWPKYKDFKRHPWNLVRLPRQTHAEVHVLMSAAFVGTEWFPKFNAARVIWHARSGSMYDSLKWQAAISKATIDGVLHIRKCLSAHGNVRDRQRTSLWTYAQRRGISTAGISEARTGARYSSFDSPKWQERIKKFTDTKGKLHISRCVAGTDKNPQSLSWYARVRGITTADVSDAKRGLFHGSQFDSPPWQKRIERSTVNGKLYVLRCVGGDMSVASALRSYAKSRGIARASKSEALILARRHKTWNSLPKIKRAHGASF